MLKIKIKHNSAEPNQPSLELTLSNLVCLIVTLVTMILGPRWKMSRNSSFSAKCKFRPGPNMAQSASYCFRRCHVSKTSVSLPNLICRSGTVSPYNAQKFNSGFNNNLLHVLYIPKKNGKKLTSIKCRMSLKVALCCFRSFFARYL